jgi:cell division protein FtsB
MLAPLEDRSVLEREEDEADALRRELDALRREREFDRRIGQQRIAALSGELDRLRARCDEQARQIAAYASGEAVVGLGRRLMELSAANEGLRGAAARAGTLQALLAATHEEFRRLAAERDALAALLAAARREPAQ